MEPQPVQRSGSRATPRQTQPIPIQPVDGVIVLPAGTRLDTIRLSGTDLLVTLPNGQVVIIIDGALSIPEIRIGAVNIPAPTIAALIAGQEPQPAAGVVRSSGGNFEQTPGDIGDPFALGDLLPDTDFSIADTEEPEVLQLVVDDEPEILVTDLTVSEANLPDGSSPDSSALTQDGSFSFEALDGVAEITIDGEVLFDGAITAGLTIVTSLGVLTITGFVPVTDGAGNVIGGTVNYSYELTDNSLLHTGPNDTSLTDSFEIVVTDSDGSVATSTLNVQILDDVPLAEPNEADADEGGTIQVDAASGLLPDDVPGADGAALAGVRAAGGNVSDPATSGIGAAITGLYGTLTVNADGSYRYVGNPNSVPLGAGVQDVFVYSLRDGDGDLSTTTLTIRIDDSGLSGDPIVAQVEEAALPTGREPSSDAETVTGDLFDAFSGGTAPYTFALTGSGVGAHGTLTLNPDGSYSYTLTAPVDGPTADNGADTMAADTFTYVVTDALGNTTQNTLTINAVDDVPLAEPNEADADEGGTIQVDAASGLLPDDVAGADGAALAGVRAAGGNVTDPATSGVGAAITGLYGTLTVNADGSYRYVGNPNSVPLGAGVQDVFVYSLRDGDGDLSTTTLTIRIDDSGLSGDAIMAQVEEAALPAGREPSSDAETVTGDLYDAFSGGTAPYTFALTGSGVGAHGTLTLNPDGSYSYTLTAPVDGPTADNGADTSVADTFTYVVTDALGNTTQNSITINVVDDVPLAEPNEADADEGGTIQVDAAGGLLPDDVAGADGAALAGVRAAGGNVSDPATSGIGAAITGLYGTLTVNADGSYRYVGNPNSVPLGAGVQDVFVYSLRDGDGDLSTTTLTIRIDDSGLSGDPIVAQVEEAALPAGREPSSDAETVTGDLFDAFSGGTAPYSFALTGSNVGAHGTLTLNPDGSYSYTLTAPVDGPTADNGADTVPADTFTYVVTDALGNTTQNTITINAVDDVPLAEPNEADADEGGTIQVDAASGLLTDDVAGADGASLAGVRAAGGNVTAPATGGVGAAITGLYGTLTVNADGSYRYVGNPNSVPLGAGVQDVFVYSLRDGDGDLSTTTLTIRIDDSGLSGDAIMAQVEEAALPTGREPSSDAETVTGDLFDAFSGGTAPYSFALTGSGVGAHGTLTLNPDGSYSYTLTTPVDGPTADNGADTVAADTFTYVVTDALGNTTQNTITINVVDDVPEARAAAAVVVVEDSATISGNLLANDSAGADGASVTSVTIGGSTVAVAAAGPTTHTDANGTYTFEANGSWTFDPAAIPGMFPVAAGFTYTITDGDGDTDTASQSITIVPLAPPVALDLDGDGVEFAPASAGVHFDYDCDGRSESTAWMATDDGLLAIDKDGDGAIRNGSELVFGDDSLSDLQGLAATYDSNGDGKLDAADAEFAKFGVWQDGNGDGVSDPGEFRSLVDTGIVSIDLTSDGKGYLAADGQVVVRGEAIFTRADGSIGKLADAAFATNFATEQQRAGISATAGISAAMLIGGLAATAPLAAQPPVDPKADATHTSDAAQPASEAPAPPPAPQTAEHQGIWLQDLFGGHEAAKPDSPEDRSIHQEDANGRTSLDAVAKMIQPDAEQQTEAANTDSPAPAARPEPHVDQVVTVAPPQAPADPAHADASALDKLAALVTGALEGPQVDLDALLGAQPPQAHLSPLQQLAAASGTPLADDMGAMAHAAMANFAEQHAAAQLEMAAATGHA